MKQKLWKSINSKGVVTLMPIETLTNIYLVNCFKKAHSKYSILKAQTDTIGKVLDILEEKKVITEEIETLVNSVIDKVTLKQYSFWESMYLSLEEEMKKRNLFLEIQNK